MPSRKKNLYEILGISKNANQDEIHGAYRKYAKRFHPDASGGEQSHEDFLAVNQAYETLKDTEKRREYDNELARQKRRGGNKRSRSSTWSRPSADDIGESFWREQNRSGMWNRPMRENEQETRDFFRGRKRGAGLSSVFGGLFRGMFEREQTSYFSEAFSAPEAAYDLDVRVTPEEARNGCSSVIRVPIEIECSVCNGEGLLYRRWCWKCNGTGRLIQESGFRLRLPPGLTDGMRLRVTAQTPEPIEFRVTVHVA